VFLSVILDFYTAEVVINLVGMQEDKKPECLFTGRLVSTDLVSSTYKFRFSRKLNLAYGVSLNLNFSQ